MIPPGHYVEVSLDMLENGNFRRRFDDAVREAYREFLQYEAASAKRDGSFTVTVKITGQRMKGSEEHLALKTTITKTVPPLHQISLVRGTEDRLVCQPEGSGPDDPDQLRLFDAHGRPKGLLDKATGELVEEPHTAGKIAGKATRA